MPADWQMAIICPVYKKGHILNCSNYRGISLINVVYKIFTNTLARYLEVYTGRLSVRVQNSTIYHSSDIYAPANN
jgi:hypothetical protein